MDRLTPTHAEPLHAPLVIAQIWRPFTGALSARSVAHALSILGAMFRWLVQQRYVLANPFAGIKVRCGGRTAALDNSHAFTEGEWKLVRTIADGLE